MVAGCDTSIGGLAGSLGGSGAGLAGLAGLIGCSGLYIGGSARLLGGFHKKNPGAKVHLDFYYHLATDGSQSRYEERLLRVKRSVTSKVGCLNFCKDLQKLRQIKPFAV